MPEPPAHNRVISPASDFPRKAGADEEAGETVAFLPPLVSRIFIAGWLLLFSGRWLVVQGMAAAGLLGSDQVERLDHGLLGICYFLLLSVTLVTLIVRIARGLNSRQDPLDSKTDFNAHVVSAIEGTAEAESTDRGGKQA